jgi:hypothetical protein
MRYLVLVVLVSFVAVPALATAPAVGNYTPSDGRFSESQYGGGGQIGNTINAQSWDLTSLGLQWILQCQSIVSSPTVLEDTRDENGTGYIKYRTVYGGGTMWLDDNGPWGDGSEDYIADIGNAGMVVTSTHLFVMGTKTGVVSDITVQGVFRDYSNCFTYALSNAVILGVAGSPATDYPEFLDVNCDSGNMSLGAWGDVDDIILSIYAPDDPFCTIPVQDATWGQIKSMYKD